MKGNLIGFDKNYSSGFTRLTKRITLGGQERQPSLKAIGMYAILCSLAPGWVLTREGFKKQFNTTRDTYKATMKELEELGYIRQIKTHINGVYSYFYYIFTNPKNTTIFDSIQKCLEDQGVIVDANCVSFIQKQFAKYLEQYGLNTDEETIQKFINQADNQNILYQEPANQPLDFQPLENQPLENQPLENRAVYIIINNIIINNIRINKYKNKNTNLPDFLEGVECTQKNNNIDNTNKDIFKFKIQKKPLVKTCNESAEKISKLMLAPAEETFPVQLTKEERKKQKQEEKLKRQQETVARIDEQFKNNSVSTQSCAAVKHTLGEMTEQDNELSQAMRCSKEILSVYKQVNKTNVQKLTRRKQLEKWLNKEVDNVTLRKSLVRFCNMYIDTFGLLSSESLGLKIDDLQQQTNGNINMMCECVDKATKSSWKDFFTTAKQQSQLATAYKPVVQAEQSVPDNRYELALDENGNPYEF